MEIPQTVEMALVGIGLVVLVVTAWLVARRVGRVGASQPEQVEDTTPRLAATSPRSEPAETTNLAARFFAGLTRSREALGRSLSRLVGAGGVDDDALRGLEDVLIGADVGVRAASAITLAVGARVKGTVDVSGLKALLRQELLARLGEPAPLREPRDGPLAVLVVGVNGSGKTTTIGKLAARYRARGQTVLLAAGDTFRAGAVEQLKVWGERAGVPVVAHREGADPAAVIFDAMQAATARGIDVVICDTAGRLQAQKPLMDELGKVVRVMGRAMPGAPHEVLLVLDATIGQNALSQARVFKEVVGVTGVVLTKLDGTARGGVVVAVCDEMGLPVKLVGLGEKIDDLRDFDPVAFVDALLGRDGEGT